MAQLLYPESLHSGSTEWVKMHDSCVAGTPSPVSLGAGPLPPSGTPSISVSQPHSLSRDGHIPTLLRQQGRELGISLTTSGSGTADEIAPRERGQNKEPEKETSAFF